MAEPYKQSVEEPEKSTKKMRLNGAFLSESRYLIHYKATLFDLDGVHALQASWQLVTPATPLSLIVS